MANHMEGYSFEQRVQLIKFYCTSSVLIERPYTHKLTTYEHK